MQTRWPLLCVALVFAGCRIAESSPDLPTVTSLEQALNWVPDGLKAISEAGMHLDATKLTPEITMSTAFSGIDSPGTALAYLWKHFGVPLQPALWALDHNPECQYELQMHPKRPACLFADIVEFLNPRIKENLRQNVGRVAFDDLHRLFSSGKTTIDS
eukprot:432157-Alexandrium_andersonii.AAC.1